MFTYPVGLLNPNISGIPRDSLIGEWLFNGNANDTSGSGNHGSVNGATLTTDRNSNADSAYYFDDSSYIEIGDVLDMGTNDWSVSLWVQSDGTGTEGLVSKSVAASLNGRWGIYLQNKRATSIIQPVSTFSLESDTLDTSWHHIVFTIDRSDVIKAYTDNSLYGSTVDISSRVSEDMQTSVILRFGSYNDGVGDPSRFLLGKLDDIRVYNRVLTSEEVTLLYNE